MIVVISIAVVSGIPAAGSDLVHGAFVALGVAVAALLFHHAVRRRGVTDDRMWVIVALALAGGALMARLGTWFQHVDLRANASLLEQWVYGNRSILSGLVGAWGGVHLGKRLTGYRERTGDLFAPAVAAAMALGRIGCLLTERPGTPTGAGFGITLPPEQAQLLGAPAGIALHPSFGYEIAFHVVAFLVIWRLRDALTRRGDLFVGYVAAYAIFRFGVEFVRGNEVVWAGLTRPQLFLLVSAPLLARRAAGIRVRTSTLTGRVT